MLKKFFGGGWGLGVGGWGVGCGVWGFTHFQKVFRFIQPALTRVGGKKFLVWGLTQVRSAYPN
ncbi:MAG: hypothetical protein EWV48_18615 [Microcystis aeruginosa Ma_QC_C_20070823_S13]|nr:MAG: hypothetical protein EWV48_18615 [Microcystis aeruginosa Ma_QC_C_20070823_S13]TRU63014.1 MAG: hypothetical protein EWV56_05975 [Microcystis aeruginosa Ma_QC_C_20070823_S13D]